MHGQIMGNLLGSDAILEGCSHGITRNETNNELGKPIVEFNEQCDQCNLKRRFGVGVHSVIGLHHNETSSLDVGRNTKRGWTTVLTNTFEKLEHETSRIESTIFSLNK